MSDQYQENILWYDPISNQFIITAVLFECVKDSDLRTRYIGYEFGRLGEWFLKKHLVFIGEF